MFLFLSNENLKFSIDKTKNDIYRIYILIVLSCLDGFLQCFLKAEMRCYTEKKKKEKRSILWKLYWLLVYSRIHGVSRKFPVD